MSGYPAGFSDGDSDDDFDDGYDDRRDKHFQEPTLASLVQQPTTTTTTTTTSKEASIFSTTNQLKTEEVEQAVSLNSEDMRLAIVKDDAQHVKRALTEGFSTDTLMQSGWTGLMYACENGSCDIVQMFLDHGASANFQKDLFSPLMAVCNSAVRNEDNLVACAQLLIEAGAKVNVHDRHVMTPLMYSAKLGYGKLVMLLCESDAQKNVQDTQGWTALTFASANGFVHVVRVLLKHKADHNLTAFDGQKPADVAFAHGHAMLADMLEKYDGDNLDEFPTETNAETAIAKSLSGKYVKYGDLELFLYGLELGDLIPLLQQHRLEFKDILKLTEDEMIEIGISQLGVRKKLLEAIRDVHTNEWDAGALSKEHISKLTTLETSAIVANIAKHLQIIQCSVKYVNKHIHAKKDDLCSDNIALQKSLVDQCGEALLCSKSLQADLQVLRNDTVYMFPNIDRSPVDVIDGGGGRKGKGYLYRRVLPVGAVLLMGGGVYAAYKKLTTT